MSDPSVPTSSPTPPIVATTPTVEGNVSGFSKQLAEPKTLLDFVNNLKNSDELDVFVGHKIDEVEELSNPVGFLLGPGCNDSVDENVSINSEENMDNGANPDLNEADTNMSSSDSDRDVIINEDDSDVDEELRSFRAERRNKRES
ncbi:hypothetical protein HAX54_052000 [Datura stramonium]|uniref:Uncharacterized protein n=1 Tax=Datura stramonium TaxID=4076 RepID=A0ABS8SZ39_DATST|nr:hypothetical protein [Datura stramonium]